jgi:two-component system heavy metal sensor histidine kinase CusS
VGFGLGGALLAGLLALFMDRALHRSFEAEDTQVLEGQARTLLQLVEAGQALPDPGGGPGPEKISWRLLDTDGRVLAQSRDLVDLRLGGLPDPRGGAEDLELEGGGLRSMLARTWRRGREQGTLLLVVDRSHEAALVQEFRRTLLLGVLVALGVAALLARAVARWGLAPLGALIAETGSISDRNLDHRLASESFPLELQELVHTLNGALARLQAAFERLNTFGAELAHELRTPLQNLRSTLENRVLAAGSAPMPPAELGALIEDCDRMAALIEQILFLARAEHGAGPIRVPVSIPELLEEVRDFFEASAEEAGVALSIQCEPGLSLRGDQLLLARALHNLVANALRHTPRGGRVALQARTEGTELLLAVEDDGFGLPDGWAPKLGMPFQRPPGERAPEGHGLGLAIVARIAAMLEGELNLERRSGPGTRAILRFRAD